MKVARLVDVERIDLFDEPIPEPKAGEVLVRMRAVGICGSDLHYFNHGGLGSHKVRLPFELGHEPAGEVVYANRSERFKEGDQIAIDPGLPCLDCEHCNQGLYNLCTRGWYMGAGTLPGAFREFVAVNERQLLKLEEGVSAEAGAMLEPFGVGFHAVQVAGVRVGQTVAVIGAGAIGLSTLAAARLAEPAETFIIDKLSYRADVARRVFAADHAIIASETDPIPYIMDATNGRGVDVAFDATGSEEAVDTCLRIAAAAGKVVLIGIPQADFLSFNPHVARMKELKILNVRRSNQTLAHCYHLYLKDRVPLEKMVTHRFPLEAIGEAFDTASCYRDGVIRAVVTFDEATATPF